MQEIRVTLLAQERNRRDQQRVLIRAMGGMAIQAILAHRRMFEKKRSALLGMTLVARFVDRVRLQQRVRERPVRVVAVIAAHLAVGQRHVGSAVELETDVAVALRTGIVDRAARQEPLHREFGHRIVAIAARQIVALMNRTGPVIPGPARVTRETRLGLRGDGRTGVFGIPDDEPFHLGIGGMRGARPMTGLAHRNRRIRPIGDVQSQGVQRVREVFRLELVAGDAGFLADGSGIRRLRIGRDGGMGEAGRRPR